jgi:hypothetical protein
MEVCRVSNIREIVIGPHETRLYVSIARRVMRYTIQSTLIRTVVNHMHPLKKHKRMIQEAFTNCRRLNDMSTK